MALKDLEADSAARLERGLAEAKEEQKEVLERLRGVQEALEKESSHGKSLVEALESKEEDAGLLRARLEQLQSKHDELGGELRLAESRREEEEAKHSKALSLARCISPLERALGVKMCLFQRLCKALHGFRLLWMWFGQVFLAGMPARPCRSWVPRRQN